MEFYIILVYPALHNIYKMPSDSKEKVQSEKILRHVEKESAPSSVNGGTENVTGRFNLL